MQQKAGGDDEDFAVPVDDEILAKQITTMPKDRLAAMQQKAGGDDEDFAVPVDDEIEGSMATYLKDIEEIRSNCDKIDGKMKDVKKLQSEMDDYMAEIKKLANTVRNKLKKMEQENSAEEEGRGSVTQELRMKKTQHMTASKRFVEVMTEYNAVQVEYREQSKNKIKRQLEIAGKTATDEELEQMLEGGGGAKLTGHIQIEGDAAQLRQTLNDIEQRHEMFIKLETSIKELQ